jgi:hypothetical protein
VGESIPISGRIVAVADVFDALTHDRPYKNAWTVREALAEIEANAGTQFDPTVVEALLRIAPEMRVLGADSDAHEQPKTAHLMTAQIAVEPDIATIATMHMLQQQRDDLEREVVELRQQLAQQASHTVRSRRWAQSN